MLILDKLKIKLQTKKTAFTLKLMRYAKLTFKHLKTYQTLILIKGLNNLFL